ncbi:WD40/YVTN/BNR-like repeat-containing protein [Zavarzinia sp.]|uniref:WD40/YVTN/BNR-like repeat-containing protein n=1 Tax=Zavarzinia sp. TaxID=2027920 RepID=UPI003BB4FC8A|nr:YCF48-related protein [Zavarzinia sp.]
MRAFSKWETVQHRLTDATRTAGSRPAEGASRRQVLALGLGAAVAVALTGKAKAAESGLRLYPDALFGIAVDGGVAVATGYHGAVAVADGDPSKWLSVSSGSDDLLRRVVRRPGAGFVAVSHRGRILESNLQGRDWRAIHEESGLYLRAVDFASESTGWAVGHEGAILMTRDGGKSWLRSEISDYAGRDKPRLSGIAAIDEKRAVAVGEFGVVAATEDGGQVWKVVTEQAHPSLLDVAIAGDRGYAVGLNGTLLALAADASGRWTVEPQATGTTQHMLCVAISASGREALIGGNGLLLTLGKSGFQAAAIAPQVQLNYTWLGGAALAEDGRAIAVGQGGLILVADNAAGTFSPAPISLATREVTQ